MAEDNEDVDKLEQNGHDINDKSNGYGSIENGHPSQQGQRQLTGNALRLNQFYALLTKMVLFGSRRWVLFTVMVRFKMVIIIKFLFVTLIFFRQLFRCLSCS